MTIINDLTFHYCEFHRVLGWMKNGSKHALVVGSVIALVSVFRQSCESLYQCNVLGDIK